MHEPIGSLDDGRDGERRGAAARGIDGEEDVLGVERGVARAVDNGRRHALEHVLDVTLSEGLLGAVGGDAEALAEEHGGVLRIRMRCVFSTLAVCTSEFWHARLCQQFPHNLDFRAG